MYQAEVACLWQDASSRLSLIAGLPALPLMDLDATLLDAMWPSGSAAEGTYVEEFCLAKPYSEASFPRNGRGRTCATVHT